MAARKAPRINHFGFLSITIFLPLPERCFSTSLRQYFIVAMSNTRAASLGQFQQERLQLPTLLLPMSEVERQLLPKVPVPVGNSDSK